MGGGGCLFVCLYCCCCCYFVLFSKRENFRGKPFSKATKQLLNSNDFFQCTYPAAVCSMHGVSGRMLASDCNDLVLCVELIQTHEKGNFRI